MMCEMLGAVALDRETREAALVVVVAAPDREAREAAPVVVAVKDSANAMLGWHGGERRLSQLSGSNEGKSF